MSPYHEEIIVPICSVSTDKCPYKSQLIARNMDWHVHCKQLRFVRMAIVSSFCSVKVKLMCIAPLLIPITVIHKLGNGYDLCSTELSFGQSYNANNAETI